MVYVRLKDFRAEHNLLQSDLAGILGCTQSFVSRMENKLLELEESQYRRLVEMFGEKEVSRFRDENPVQNALGATRRVRRINPRGQVGPSGVRALAEVVKRQQDEIARLNARIAELTDLLLKK